MFRMLSTAVLGFCAYSHYDESKKVDSPARKQSHEVAAVVFGALAVINVLR